MCVYLFLNDQEHRLPESKWTRIVFPGMARNAGKPLLAYAKATSNAFFASQFYLGAYERTNHHSIAMHKFIEVGSSKEDEAEYVGFATGDAVGIAIGDPEVDASTGNVVGLILGDVEDVPAGGGVVGIKVATSAPVGAAEGAVMGVAVIWLPFTSTTVRDSATGPSTSVTRTV
jgi:hypothetical protein